MDRSGEATPRTNRIFVLPNGLNWETPEIGNGSIIINPTRDELTMQDRPILSHMNNFDDKVRKVLVHLIRFPSESSLKITYYVSSWKDVPEDLKKYFAAEYLEWFQETVTNIPPVNVLCRRLRATKAKQLPAALINLLLWLLVGLREPKLCPVREVGFAKRIFGDFTTVGKIRNVYRLEYSSLEKAHKEDVMRYEFGYICQRTEDVYGFLYHFEITGTHQFFVDQPHHALIDRDFGYPLWSGSPIKKPICTLLVMEWTPQSARPFISHKVDVPRLEDPNFFYYRCTKGARMSHVVILEPKPARLRIPLSIHCLMRDGLSVSWFILASLLFTAVWFKMRIPLGLR